MGEQHHQCGNDVGDCHEGDDGAGNMCDTFYPAKDDQSNQQGEYAADDQL